MRVVIERGMREEGEEDIKDEEKESHCTCGKLQPVKSRKIFL